MTSKDVDYLISVTTRISKAFENDPTIFDTYRAEFAFRNLAVLSDRMGSGSQMNEISDPHRRSLSRLEERVKALIDCKGQAYPLHALQQKVRDGGVPEHQRAVFTEILLDGNNLLISMLTAGEVNESIIGYFTGNANAVHA